MSTPDAPAPDVFISYHRATHLAQAELLHQALTAQGVRAFKDDQCLRASQRWQEELGRALHGCRRFVVLLGPRGLERWVGAETEIALSRYFGAHEASQRPQIVPVLLPGAPALETLPFLGLLQGVAWPAGEAPPAALLAALTQALPGQDAAPAELPASALLKPEECPWVGLAPFQKEQAARFFGRERDVLAALARLGRESATALGWAEGGAAEHHTAGPVGSLAPYKRWLNVVGGSGSGKSSLVRAGLLPLMAQGALSARTGIGTWHVSAPMLPGRDPLTALAEVLGPALHQPSLALLRELRDGPPQTLRLWLNDALHALPHSADASQGVLLVIDQFEELFTLAEPAACARLDELLAEALAVPGGPLHVVSTCRSDYQHRITEDLPRLAALLNTQASTYTLAPMDAAGLRLAITEPARLGRVTVAPDLLQALLDDAQQDLAAALPLVQHTMETLWHTQCAPLAAGAPRGLTQAHYEACGRLGGILAREADRLLLQLGDEGSKPHQGALELLLALSHYHAEGRHTRQSLTWEQAQRQAGQGLKAADLARGEAVLNHLSGLRGAEGAAQGARLRLITVDGSQPGQEAADTRRVDLIHEALLRSRHAEAGQSAQPYWPRLVAYLEQHKDRDVLRQQLRLEAENWPRLGWLGRLLGGPSWGTLKRYRALRLLANAQEQRYLRGARWPAWGRQLAVKVSAGALVGLLGLELLAPQVASVMGRDSVQDLVMTWRWGSAPPPLPELVTIPLGAFEYGCKPGRDDLRLGARGIQILFKQCDEHSHRRVDVRVLPQPCTQMGRYEVTQAQFDYYIWHRRQHTPAGQAKPSYPPIPPNVSNRNWRDGSLPVVNVSYHDAQGYLAWLNQQTGGPTWRLPTEEEWEYAARAPGQPQSAEGPYWWGNDEEPHFRARANCSGCDPRFKNRVAPVGSYAPNPFGLYDTAGGVWEWTSSIYTPNNRPFVGTPEEEEKAANDASVGRVLRGGSWLNVPAILRAAFRVRYHPDVRNYFFGFRVCRASPI